jgi:hypothetical protein
LPVKAFSRPPAAATRREKSPGATVFVPLNIMCSSTCATPVTPFVSSMLPTRYQRRCATVGARLSSLTMTRKPFASVRS